MAVEGGLHTGRLLGPRMEAPRGPCTQGIVGARYQVVGEGGGQEREETQLHGLIGLVQTPTSSQQPTSSVQGFQGQEKW